MKRILASLLSLAGILSADTLHLRNGSKVEGSFLGGDGRSIRFLVGSQVTRYNVSDVESIRFTGDEPNGAASPYPPQSSTRPVTPNTPPPATAPEPAPATTAYPAPPPSASYPPRSRGVNEGYGNGYPNSAEPAPAPPNNAGIEVPSGTRIVVRLIDPVNSERDNLGQTYRASLDQPVIVNGETVIPRGADAVAALIDAKQSGKIEGRTVLTLDLKTVTVNGRTYDVVTAGVPEASGSRGERSAKVIGGAAALGAIIGAAAGGGKGAAIGAGAGAGAGTAAEIATSGQKVHVPAETRLTFTLQNPIAL
jgi:hypothetical protein